MKRYCVLLFALFLIGTTQAQVGVYKSSGYGAIQKQKKPKSPLPNAMIGVSGGVGITANQYVIYPNGAFGFDFAISMKPKWALGAYTQWGILENWSFGAQVVTGDFANNKSAFVFGVGFALNFRGLRGTYTGGNNSYSWHDGYCYSSTFTRNGVLTRRDIYYSSEVICGPSLRLGLTTKKHFFMALDVNVFPNIYKRITERYEQKGDFWYGAMAVEQTAATMTISFGYAIPVRPKQK